MSWREREKTADTRYVGYFPTPQFWTIITLWNEELVKKQVTVLKLKCRRARMRAKNVLTPLPYLEVIELEEKNIEVDYDFRRHGPLNIDRLKDGVAKQDVKELVVETLVVHIPKDLLKEATHSELDEEAEINGWKTGENIAATFRRTKAILDGKFRKEIRKHTKEWLEIGGKISSLDLVGLREAKYWHRKGIYGTYDVHYNPRTVRLVMRALDPFGTLGRWREYKKKKGTVWSLTRDESIRKEV